MQTLEVLLTAAKIERKISDIYDIFRKTFNKDKTISSFWEILVNEEEAHAGFLDAESVMLRLKPDTFGKAVVGADILKDSLREMEELERRVKRGVADHKEALPIALIIETEVVEKRYNKLIEIGDPYIKKVFADLNKKDDHVEKLVLAANKLGVKVKHA